MNLVLNYEGFENNLVSTFTRGMPDEIHYIFKFENGLGASVIKANFSYGHEDDLWELAPIVWWSPDYFDIVGFEDITGSDDEVIGWRTDEEIRELLKKIRDRLTK